MKNKKLFNVSLAVLITAVMIFSIFGTVNVAPTNINGESQYLLAHFTELPSAETRARIEATGVTIINYQGDGNYLVKVPGTFSRESMLGILSDNIAIYPESIKVSSKLDGMTGVVPIRVSLHQGENVDSVMTVLISKGATIDKVHDILAPYILCNMDASNIQSIAALNQVSAIHPNPEPETCMSLITSNTYMGQDTALAGGFTGSGMLGEVQDNGIDRTHPDLQNVDYTDGSVVVDHHGTCTSGIVFGTGIGDMNAQGMAPQAVGAFADWATGRTLSVQHLWTGLFPTGNAGMNGVVQSNSWSAGSCDGLYVATTAEDDAAVVAYPKVLTLWAAANSNDGTAEGLISEDSANKNGMCIGAIWHQDTAIMTDDRYEDQGVGNTPSRGPSADGRMKPDMAGCFDHIYTVDCVGTDGYAATNYYDNFGGTSGATPEVAGASLLAYEMYKENYFGNNPTNAIPYSSTIKALMIADAFQYPLTGTYSASRTCQGWGCPDMEKMYNLGAIYHQFDEYPQAMSSGSTWTRQVYADAVNPLKITLCWIDPAAPSTTGAARALRNNLDLKVTSPGGVIYYGNNGLWDSLYSTSGTVVNHWSTSASYRDDLNNVENVFLQTPQNGIWTIEVSGRTGDIASGPQQFSLVSSGAMIPIPSKGTIDIENPVYPREASVMIEVKDRDLNTVTTTVQTVNVNLKSVAEPAGETTLLTETGVDTGIFRGTKTISATNSVGVVMVNAADTLTATYNDANDGTGSPAVATDTATVDGTAPAAPTGLTVQHWGPAITYSAPVTGARYLRGVVSEAVVNGLTCYSLGTAQSTVAGNWAAGTNVAVYLGMRVYKRTSAGVETEITTALSATASRTAAGSGFQTATWTPPETVLATGDSIVIKIYGATTANPTTLRATFTTGQIGPARLDALQWTVQYWTRVAGNPNGSDWYWGTATYDNNIAGFQYTPFVARDPYQDNTMNWTASGSGDVASYNVYRAAVSGGPYTLVGSSPVGTNTYVDSLKGAADATLWWYRVRAVDAAGNEETNVNNVPEGIIPLVPYSINLAGKIVNSWVFVSFPSAMSGAINTILTDTGPGGDGLTTWTVAKWFNIQDKNDPWKTYRVGSSVNDMPVLTNQMGVWLYITANGGDQKLTLSSYVANSSVNVVINLYAGWNLVGYPTATSRAESATLTNAFIDLVASWQAASPYITQHAKGATLMVPGNAYWVHTTADCTWSVAP